MTIHSDYLNNRNNLDAEYGAMNLENIAGGNAMEGLNAVRRTLNWILKRIETQCNLARMVVIYSLHVTVRRLAVAIRTNRSEDIYMCIYIYIIPNCP